jgi:uncharacterized membrane protein
MSTHPQAGYTHLMYALHALAGFIGVTSSATIAGAFVFGLPSIIAILMNYARRDAVRGSWIESHFLWQARTFWIALVLLVGLFAIALVLAVIGVLGLLLTPFTGGASAVGAGVSFAGAYLALTVGAFVTGLWILYRVIRGWMALRDGRAMNV